MIINFNENYNNKLNSTYFTTIRKNSNKYNVGEICEIHLNNEFLFNAQIIHKAFDYFFNITTFELCVDTGMPAGEAIDLFVNKFNIKQDEVVIMILLKKIELEEV
jgi:hypothetical protein